MHFAAEEWCGSIGRGENLNLDAFCGLVAGIQILRILWFYGFRKKVVDNRRKPW